MIVIDLNSRAQEWIAAWNAHDLERILAHYADNVELTFPFVARLTGRSEGSARGKAALRDYFARGLQAFPTLRFDFIRLYSGVRSCVLEYHSVSGLRTAELMEFDAQGKVRRVLAHYCDARIAACADTFHAFA
ncbi:MAG: nuclear transport factor 2 family protein [Verrucomicrobia subdivision 3 bacterium]|nr:nuclear transport factor 2 family protein [Limisphaerales bacterium]